MNDKQGDVVKKFMILVIMLLLSMPLFALTMGPVPDEPIDQCMTGAWYNPDMDGEGIELTVLEDSLYGYLYTYKGTSPDWYIFAGPLGKSKVNLYKTIKTSDPWKATAHEVGSMAYDVIDKNHITFTMKLQMDLWRDVTFPLCLTNCTRVFEYERLTELPRIPCLEYSQ